MHTLLNYSKENRKEISWNNTGSKRFRSDNRIFRYLLCCGFGGYDYGRHTPIALSVCNSFNCSRGMDSIYVCYGKSAESRCGSHDEPICSNRFRGFWGACESVAWELDCLFYFSGNHSEIIRKWAGYKNYKGIVMSYILLSLSNIGSPLYVWVFSDYAISEASEEVSANYAEILSTLTSPWFMVLAIAATVVISIIVGVIAKKVYNKQFANAGIM